MEKKNFTAPLIVKSLDEGGYFEGYASMFGVIDSDGDVIVKGAFKGSIENFRSTGRRPKMLWQHDATKMIGKWVEIAEDDQGLWVKGRFILEVAQAREAYALMKEGELDAMSVGFNIASEEDSPIGTGRVITNADLWETSLVTWGANPAARITNVKSIKDFERLLRDAGFSRSKATAIASKGYKASINRSDSDEINREVLRSIEQLTNKFKGITHG